MKQAIEDLDPSMRLLDQRERQLWWLAVLVILLLACAVTIMDWSSVLQVDSYQFLTLALDSKTMRIALILSVLSISAYFRDSSRRLRRTNNKLITELKELTVGLRRKNVEIATLKELSDEMINMTDLRKALNVALDKGLAIIEADSASIMLRDKGTNIMRIVVARGLQEEVIRNAQVEVGDSLSGIVAERGEALIVNSDDMQGSLEEYANRRSELVSAVIVPICIDSEVRGVLNASKRRGGTCFSEDDLRVLSTLANQAALVLRKIELWDDLQEQVRKLGQALDELRQTQAELVQSEKLASIGQVAGGMAHEINNPLQVIIGRIELALNDFPEESSEAQTLRVVLRHAERISDIVAGLLRFSRRQPEEEKDDVSIDYAVQEAVELLGNQMNVDNVSLHLDLDSDGGSIVGSRVKIEQVFMNLLINAHQAMRNAGGEIRIKSRFDGERVIVTVTDSGPGIPPDFLPHIFEPFFTTKQEGEGTGLGLSVTYGIVESHGGRIEVASEVGKGTEFTLQFPAKEGAVAGG